MMTVISERDLAAPVETMTLVELDDTWIHGYMLTNLVPGW